MSDQLPKVNARERLEEEYKVWTTYHPKVRLYDTLYYNILYFIRILSLYGYGYPKLGEIAVSTV